MSLLHFSAVFPCSWTDVSTAQYVIASNDWLDKVTKGKYEVHGGYIWVWMRRGRMPESSYKVPEATGSINQPPKPWR